MTTANSKNSTPGFEAAFGQFKDFNDQFLAAGRKAGHVYLDTYEKAVDRAIELELTLAGLTQQEWLKGLIETQADIAREITSTYTSTARSLLK